MTNSILESIALIKLVSLLDVKKVILQKEKKNHKIAQKLYNDLKKTLGEKYHGAKRIKHIIIK